MPRSKKDTIRIIDTKPEVIGGGTIQTQALTIAPPPTGEVAAPSNLTATASGVARSPVKPEAYVNVTWRAPLGAVPTYYDIEYGRSSEWNNTTKTFTNPQRVQSYNLGATLSLGLNTAYRIRVRSVYRNATSAWTDTVEVTTADDTTPASPVTNVATNWNPVTGDLTITWTNPTDPQFRDARVRIYSDAGKLTLYRTAFSNSGRYVYTYDQNMQDSTSGDTSLVITIDTRNWASSGTVYSTGVDVTATLSNPGNVSGVTTTLNTLTGEAVWRWTALSNVTGYRLTIDGTARDVFTNEYRYSLAQNRAEHLGSIDTSLAWNLVAYNALNQVSTTATTGTATFTAPATPTGLAVNFDNPDCVFSWTLGTDVTGYKLSIDGVVRDLGLVDRFTYTLGQNESEHTVAPTPDHTLTYILTAYNALEQTTSTTSATITSPAPNAPTAVTLTAFFNVLAAVITGHVRLPTHKRYKFEFRKDGATHKVIYSTENTASLEINETGSYVVRVSAEDVFSRSSGTFDSAAVVPDVLTLEELREDAIYSDSVGTALATLDKLKDNNTTSDGVTYALGTTWKWTRFERPMLDRYRTVTAGLFSPTAGTQIYFSTSSDNSTWQWWTGPLSSNRLISVGTELLAQSGAITIGTTYANTTRWDLSSIVEARYVRIHHRNTTSNYTIREFYPRRLIQSDDIEAESILAINIAAGTITGNNIAGNTITATNIAANTITGDKISSATTITAGTGNNVGVLDGTGTWRIYAGNTNPTLAPFRVNQAGALTATGANITGAITVTGGDAATQAFATTAANTAQSNAQTYAETYNNLRTVVGFTGTIAPTSANSVSWNTVVLYLSNNTTVTITNGSATGITGLRYISWVPGTVVFTVGTTPTTTVGAVLIAIVQNGAVTANVQVLVGRTYISGDWINTGTITATNIAASTITGDKIAANTITTRSLLVSSTGMSLTDDPNTIDIEAWSGGSSISIVTDSTSPSGKALQVSSAVGIGVFSNTYFPIDNAKNYIARIWGRQVSGTKTNYLTIAFYDSAFANVSSSATGWPAIGAYCYFGVINQVLPSTWTEYTISFGPNETAKIPATARYVRIGVLASWSGTGTTVTNYTRLIIAEKTTASLIVDGTITTNKLSATAIDGMTITGSTIRTGASGARVVLDSTGLTTYNSSNQVQIEATTGNVGELRAGQGVVRLGRDGLRLFTEATSTTKAIQWIIVDPANPTTRNGKVMAGVDGSWSTGGLTSQDVFTRKATATDPDTRTQLSAYNESGGLEGRVEVQESQVTVTTNGTQRALFNSAGIAVNGVVFPAAQVPSANANTLDDYEEGTWSPTYTTTGTNFTSVTYAGFRAGRFTKIGNYVTAWFTIATSAVNKGTANGSVMIGGLPFASSNVTALYCTGSLGAAVTFLANVPSKVVMNINDSRAFLYYRDAADGNTVQLQVADIATTGPDSNVTMGTLTYMV